jgi:DNA-binding SARP family transcriptional activator/WD40 repeat protein
MRIGVLGPVAVDPGDARIGGPRQRRLLAALLLESGRVVSIDRLAEIVFEGEPTNAAAVTLRSYVARLRKAMEGLEPSIETRAPGYVLELGSATVDAGLFESSLLEAGSLHSEGQIAEALGIVRSGLELWRGPAYADFADEDWVRPEAIRLDELRIAAVELRLACLLDLGRHEEATPELAALADRHPMRERTRMLLITGLYRSGRQAEAVRAATAYREELAEVGLEPTADFADVEERVVVQDPELRRPPRAGRTLRGYRLGERLGGDDELQIHTALQPGVERAVVVTSYGPSIADDPRFIRSFDTVLRRVVRLDHPRLLEILDFWREPGSAHMVTRFVRGGDLGRLLEKAPLAAATVADLATQIAAALAAAHAEGLWHGRLESKHVLVDDTGSIHVAGVGTTDIIDSIRRRDGRGFEGQPGPARDQVALAGLILQALTGIAPIGPGEGLRGMPRVSEIRPELLALDGVLARAGAPYHGDRYPDITAFARAFADAIGAEAPIQTKLARHNPYKGLRAFDEADAAEFFGREALVAELLDRISHEHLVAVVGASGSGKSSAVRAGVIPRMRASNARLVTTMVPGSSPFAELTEALRRVVPLHRAARLDAAVEGVTDAFRGALGSDGLLLVVDQFEELYTLVDDATERNRFIDGLMDAIEDDAIDLRVLLTLRADFFDRPLQHHRLGCALADGVVAIPAMSPAELERAIVEPAAGVGVEVDSTVVTELVTDVADQPAALPLLQFSLTELFETRRGDHIGVEDHARLGGVAGAIAGRAERLYEGAIAGEQELIRILFLRLVTVTAGSADLRRRTDRSELLSAAPDPVTMDRIIDRFGSARLLTFDRNPVSRGPTVEVAHEALLRHWPRLQAWVAEAGRDLEIRAHLTTSAADWVASGRDDGELYRGARLVVTEGWVGRRDLTGSERAFLEASLERRRAEEEAERRQREAQVRSNWRLRRALGGVGVLLVVALVAGFVAVTQRNRAQEEAASAQSALGGTLGAFAESAVGDDRSLALLLAVEASRFDPSDRTRRAVLKALSGDGEPFTRTIIPTPASDYLSLVLTPDGSTAVAKRVDGSIDLIDLADRTVTHAGLVGPASISGGLDVSDNGEGVVVSGIPVDGAAAIVYSSSDGEEMLRLPERVVGRFHQAVFLPDSTQILLGDAEGALTVYDGQSGELVRTIDRGRAAEVIALDVQGSTAYVLDVFAVGDGEPSHLSAWDIHTGDLLAGPVMIENDLVGRVLAAGATVYTAGDTVLGFDAQTLELVVDGFGFAPANYLGLAVSPHGLIAAGNGISLSVWFPGGSGSDGTDPTPLPVQGRAVGVAFTPDGSTVVSTDQDGYLSTWHLDYVSDLGVALDPAGPGLAALSPAGDVLAIWARGRGVQLFDAGSGDHLGSLDRLGSGDSFLGFDFSPEGTRIATVTCPQDQVGADCDAVVQLFDVSTRERIAGPADVGPVWWEVGKGLEFSADGGRVVVASSLEQGSIVVLDADTLEPAGTPLRLGDVAPAAGTRTMVVTAGEKDGRSLVAGVGEFGQAAVWDITDTATPVGWVGYLGTAIWFGPDGALYIGSGNGVVVVDSLTLDRVAELDVDEPVFGFAASDTGLLVVNSVSGGTTLFDVGTGQRLSGDIPAFGSDIAPDGSRVYLGAWGEGPGGREVSVLPLELDHLVAEACQRAGRNLTADEWRQYMPADLERRATCVEWALPEQ